jgi:hypothetical protein
VPRRTDVDRGGTTTASRCRPRRAQSPAARPLHLPRPQGRTGATLPKLKDRQVADAYLLMLASASRPNEAAFVEAEDIIRMREDRVWRIPEHKSKERREFLIPLTGPAHAEGDVRAIYNVWTYWPERKEALRLWHEKLEEVLSNVVYGTASQAACFLMPSSNTTPRTTSARRVAPLRARQCFWADIASL